MELQSCKLHIRIYRVISSGLSKSFLDTDKTQCIIRSQTMPALSMGERNRKKKNTIHSLKMTSSSSSASCFGAEWTTLSNSLPGGGRHALAYASSLSSLGDAQEEEDRHYVLGGYDAHGQPCRTVWETNVSLQTFATQTPLPESRLSAAATAMDSQRFMIVGGITTSESCQVYDTRTQQWITNHDNNDNAFSWPNLNIGRYQHACCCVSTPTTTSTNNHNKIYTIGGYSHNYGPLDVIEELDLSLPIPSWRILPQRLQQKRSGCCVVVDPHNPHNLIVVGGFNKKDKTLATCEIVSLEPQQPPTPQQEAPTAALLQQQQQQQQQHQSTTTTRRRTLPSMTTPRANHTMVLVENRFLVVMGGNCYNHKHRFNNNHRNNKRNKNHKKKNKRHVVLSSVEVLDLEQEPHRLQWRTLPSMKTPRSRFAAFYSPRNHKIVVVAGGGQQQQQHDNDDNDNNDNNDDTVEELQVHYRQQRRRPRRRRQEEEEEGISSSSSLTPSTNHYYHHPRRCFVPPPLKELAREETTTTRIHRTKMLQHWLDETEQQMADFVASVDAREKELLWERDENRRICNNHVAHVHAKQNEARLLLGTQPHHGNRFRRLRRHRGNHHVQVNDNDNENDYFYDEEQDDYNDYNDDDGAGLVHSWGDLQKPPRLTQLSLGSAGALGGCLGWTRRRRRHNHKHHNRIGLWIVENERRKNAYAAAIDTHETQLMRELNENRRVCNEYVGRVRALQEQTKRRLLLGSSSSNSMTTTTTPHELLCPITQEVMVDPVLTAADGHTYERTAIERVLKEQDDPRSPVTGLLLTTRLLVPNVALRSLCRDYHQSHSSSSSSSFNNNNTTTQKGGSMD